MVTSLVVHTSDSLRPQVLAYPSLKIDILDKGIPIIAAALIDSSVVLPKKELDIYAAQIAAWPETLRE